MKTKLHLPVSNAYRFLLTSIIILITLLTISCSPKTAPSAQISQPLSEIKQDTKQTLVNAWEAEWEKTLNDAKKERSVVVYSSSAGPTLKDAINIFRQKYGIAL